MRRVYRRIPLVLIVALTAAAPAAAAGGPGAPPSEEDAVVAQYVEIFPGSNGPTTKSEDQQPVARDLEQLIESEGSTDSGRLKALLESPTYGGPSTAPRETTAVHQDLENVPELPRSGPQAGGGAFASVVTATPGGTTAFWILLVTATLIPLGVRRAAQRERSDRVG